jgi:ferredoxin
MAFVVTEPCHDCKYTDCVAVCPCECFYQDEWMLYIDPDQCTDCDACASECPVEAIFPEAEVPQQWIHYVALNAERTAALIARNTGHITERQQPKEGLACRKAS